MRYTGTPSTSSAVTARAPPGRNGTASGLRTALTLALGSGGLAILFFAQLPRLGAASVVGPLLFVASLVLGIALVWAAGEVVVHGD